MIIIIFPRCIAFQDPFTIVAIPGVLCLAQGHSGDNKDPWSCMAWTYKALAIRLWLHHYAWHVMCVHVMILFTQNMWPYDAKTIRIFITGKCCNPFSDPPALCTELTTGSSHGLRGVNKNSGILRSPMPLFVQNKVPCVFHYVTDKRTSVRNMPAVSKTYYYSTYIFFFYFVTTIFTLYYKLCQIIPWYYHDTWPKHSLQSITIVPSS